MGHRVLLVDDEPSLLAGLKRALSREAYDLVCATSAEEAFTILRKESVDVVVSDQDMPGMPGTVFLATVRQSFPGTVRFMLTGKATVESTIEAINDGAIRRFFTKPCDPVDLAVSIRRALRERDLIRAACDLLQKFKHHACLLDRLEKEHSGITRVDRDEDGAIVMGELPDPETLLREINEVLENQKST